MTFDYDGMIVTQPLDPYQGPRYTKLVDDNIELDIIDHLYHLTIGKRANYINPTTDGSESWRSVQSMDEDSEATFNNWKQGWYEKFSKLCTTIHSIR